MPSNVPTIPVNVQPFRPAVASNATPTTPVAPPIALKYFGYTTKKDGRTVAFLTDGDEILLVGENQTVKQRYRIVRIARTSIVIEDTQAKSTQTLTLQEIAS